MLKEDLTFQKADGVKGGAMAINQIHTSEDPMGFIGGAIKK